MSAPKCLSVDCENPPSHMVIWPGDPERPACFGCASRLQAIARSMGSVFHARPIDIHDLMRAAVTVEPPSIDADPEALAAISKLVELGYSPAEVHEAMGRLDAQEAGDAG